MDSSSDFSAASGAKDSRISNIKSDDGMKRNDSYSKFGQMETINLFPSDVEQPTEATASFGYVTSSDINVSEPPNIALDGNSDKIGASSVGAAECQGPGEATVKVGEYFKTNPLLQSSTAPEAFFSKEVKSSNNDSNEEPKQTDLDGIAGATSQPALLKFFIEDKSGSDADGKAFFDKIATAPVNSCSQNPGVNYHDKLDKSFDSGQVFAETIPPNKSVDAPVLGSVPPNIEMYDAWLPSEATRNILKSISASPETFIPDKQNLTEPTVIIEEEMEDPLKVLLTEVSSPYAMQRKVLSANDVLQNEDGVKELIDVHCYHAAINLTTRLLRSGYGREQTLITAKLLQIWFTRIALFVKLGKYSYAEVECEAFGCFDRPDLYYEFYPHAYPNRRGTMVPFSFRLLVAELPQYQGNHQVALNNLYGLLLTIQKIMLNLENGFAEDGSVMRLSEDRRKTSKDLWKLRETRVFYSVLNCVLSQKDYIMSISVAQILMEKDREHLMQIYSALGRIYLQLGDLTQAQFYFKHVQKDYQNCSDEEMELEQLINSALLAVAHNDNKEAYKLYQKALAIQPNNPMLVNNIAVCLLYMGRLKDSLNLLEKTIQANPKACLHEGILFNICTLYELESSHCTTKKHAMLNLVSKYAGDNLNVSCLKISPNAK